MRGSPFLRGYNRTLAELRRGEGCPQCRAYHLRQAIGRPDTDYQRGQREACLKVLLQPHGCGADRKPRAGGIERMRSVVSLYR